MKNLSLYIINFLYFRYYLRFKVIHVYNTVICVEYIMYINYSTIYNIYSLYIYKIQLNIFTSYIILYRVYLLKEAQYKEYIIFIHHNCFLYSIIHFYFSLYHMINKSKHIRKIIKPKSPNSFCMWNVFSLD